MKFDIDKEMEKLEDLEFEYNMARLSRQDEEIIKLAKGKFLRQVNKVRKIREMASNKQKD